MENSMDFAQIYKRLSALKYPELRKEAKRYSIKANQKKDVLVEELSKIWKHCDEHNKENIDPKKLEEPALSEVIQDPTEGEQNHTLNETFTVDEESDNGSVTDKKRYSTRLYSKNSTEKNTRSLDQEIASISINGSSYSQNIGPTSTLRSHKAQPGQLAAHFAALHQKLAEKQPTLQEVDENVKRKFMKHEESVPDVFKRLATPKASKIADPKRATKDVPVGYNFKNANVDPSKMNFSFSKMHNVANASNEKPSISKTVSQSKLPRPLRLQNVGVKELTKNIHAKELFRSSKLAEHVNSATIPRMTPRLQGLAIPRGKNRDVTLTENEKETSAKSGRRYTPRLGRLPPFVDTTKMTDRQFLEAKMLGQIHTLTALSHTKTRMRQQLYQERQEARERLMRVKRGC